MLLANNYGDEQVLCPFFHEQDKTQIRCRDGDAENELAGVVRRGRFLGFCSAGQKDNWMTNYCTGFLYQTCETYKELEEEWKRREEKQKPSCSGASSSSRQLSGTKR